MENKILETPTSKKKIEFKTWITGADAEYINSPMFDSLNTSSLDKPEVKIGSTTINAINHRLIEKFIVSVEGKTDNILDSVLNLPEEDTQFVYDTIAEIRKKK